MARLLLQIIKFLAGLDFLDGVAVRLDDVQHGFDVVLLARFGHVRTTGIAVAGECADARGELGALLVGVAGHHCRDGAGERAAFIAVVRQPVAHDERAEIGVTEAERAEDVGILGDVLRRIARVIHDDFLRGDENADGGLETFHVEFAVLAFEFHQIQRRQVAGGVVEEDVFAARVGGMDGVGALAGVPFLDRAVVLHAGVAADPGALGNFGKQRRGILLFERLAGGDGACPPFPAVHRGLHELVAGAHGKILVLIHHAAVGVAVVGTVVALLDQGPRLLFLLLFRVNELLDVAVPVAERVHLGGAPGFAAGLHDVGHLVVNLQKRQRPARTSAAAQFFPLRAQRRQIRAGAGAEFEQHRLAVRQPHDAFHVVVHRLDEAGAALRIFVLCMGALGLAGLAVVKPVALAGIFADAVLVEKPDVEPDRRIEGAVLVHA